MHRALFISHETTRRVLIRVERNKGMGVQISTSRRDAECDVNSDEPLVDGGKRLVEVHLSEDTPMPHKRALETCKTVIVTIIIPDVEPRDYGRSRDREGRLLSLLPETPYNERKPTRNACRQSNKTLKHTSMRRRHHNTNAQSRQLCGVSMRGHKRSK